MTTINHELLPPTRLGTGSLVDHNRHHFLFNLTFLAMWYVRSWFSDQGSNPHPPALETQSINHWTVREVLLITLYYLTSGPFHTLPMIPQSRHLNFCSFTKREQRHHWIVPNDLFKITRLGLAKSMAKLESSCSEVQAVAFSSSSGCLLFTHEVMWFQYGETRNIFLTAMRKANSASRRDRKI